MKRVVFCLLVILAFLSQSDHCLARTGVSIGLYPGYYGSTQDDSYIPIRAVDSAVGFRISYRNLYFNFTPQDLDTNSWAYISLFRKIDTIIAIGATPIIMAQLDPATNLADFQRTVFDAPLNVFFRELAKRNHLILLSWCHEMNGNWNSWGQQDANYRSSFRRIHNLVANISNKIKMCWVPNWGWGFPYDKKSTLDSNDCYNLYYPGNEYVDYVGLNMYFRDWYETNTVPANWLPDILDYKNFYVDYVSATRPMLIMETSSFDANQDPTAPSVRTPLIANQQKEQKVAYLGQVLDPIMLRRYPNLRVISFFHVLKQEVMSTKNHDFGNIYTDWRLPFTDSRVATMLANSYFVPSILDSSATSYPEAVADDLLVYPNPSSSYLIIHSLVNDDCAWEIVQPATGMILRQGLCNGQAILNIEAIPAGVYYCLVKRRGQTTAIKFVKD